MTATVTKRLTQNSQFARAAMRKGKQVLLQRAQVVGADAVRRVDEIVAKDYNNERDGQRSKGGTKLLGSFSSTATWDGSDTGNVVLTLTSSADPAKVMSLERGSKAHEISPSGGERLAFPSTTPRASSISKRKVPKPAKFRPNPFNAEYSGASKRLARPKSVTHPGTSAGRFMERALNSAVQAAFRGALRRRRT